MEIMTRFLERHNIYVPNFVINKEQENLADSEEQCHNVHSQDNECYDFSARVK